MALLGKRKAAPESELITTTRSRKQTKTEHSTAAQPSIPSRPLPSRDADKENINTRLKRKRADGDEQDTGASCKRLLKQNVTPKGKRVSKVMPPSPFDTPSRKTAKLFDRLDIKTASSAQASYGTPPTTPPRGLSGFSDALPAVITDTTSLHAALLSAINSQTALDSTAFRLPVQDILTATTSTWRKRTVTLEDIRRVMAIARLDWILEDYGRAGLSLVREGSNANVTILDSNKMKRDFELELRRQYTHWQRIHADDVDGSIFISQLPCAPITRSALVERSIQSRGKERLASIRNAQMVAETTTTATTAEITTNANSRGSSLLDRVLAKQAFMATLPAGPSKSQLERKSSLQRVEETARILDVLSSGRARASFSMMSVVQQVQQSLRSPMSRVEVERCLSIMATEIMPNFVSIVASGSVICVVITRAGKLDLADLKKMLADVDH